MCQSVLNNNSKDHNLIIHVPHASTHIPENLRKDFIVENDLIDRESSISADLYTEQLARQAWPMATIIEAKISRIVLDVERYEDDSKEIMSKFGRGIIYTRSHDGKKIRAEVSQKKRQALIEQYYVPHWKKLRDTAKGKILIDLHSYPVEPWFIETRPNDSRPEIDLGFTEELTPTNWVMSITNHFKNLDFEVGHNTPYSGVIDAGAKAAIMIEIRRDVVGSPQHSLQWKRLVNALNSMPLEFE